MEAVHKQIETLIKTVGTDPAKAGVIRHLSRALEGCKEFLPKKPAAQKSAPDAAAKPAAAKSMGTRPKR